MIIIGEGINSSRKAVKKALDEKDALVICNEARAQIEAGAQFLDLNCALAKNGEPEDMKWLIETVQRAATVPLCIDSPDPNVVTGALKLCKEKPIINSITAQKERYSSILPLIAKEHCGVVALTMDEDRMPHTAEERFKCAKNLYNIMKREDIPDEDIFFDPLVRPISSEPGQAIELLKAIPMIKKLGEVKVVCGISNISFGLPRRSLVNSLFLSMAINAGLDGALIDPLDKNMIAAIRTTEALLGKDNYCMNFIQGHRKGLF